MEESYWGSAPPADEDAEDELIAHARRLLNGHSNWKWRRNGIWMSVTPTGTMIPRQGWKLHVSATSRSAEDVLTSVVPLLLEEAVPFKFAATRKWVSWLNSPDTPREAAGKFITIYPVDDAQAVRLAMACDRATEGLVGPAILSDQALKRGSLVHYRYGAFQGTRIFDDDGELVYVIYDTDGRPVPDERRAWFSPPAWVTDPFAAAMATGEGERKGENNETGFSRRRQPGRPVLLNDRYIVREALKHANKGGVYLGEDRISGATVVIKEARGHVEVGHRGHNAIDVLRREAELLRLVAPLGCAPQLLEVFEQQGHLFVVLEHLAGEVLREYIAQRLADGGQGLGAEELQMMIRQLAETMELFHDAGVLLRDFTANNLMVMPDGNLRLVDLELAHQLSDGPPPGSGAGTPGFASPEQMAARPSGLPDDYYALGATIAFVATGSSPNFAPDRGKARPLGERRRDWISRAEHAGLVSTRVCDLVLHCMADDPAERWGPRQVLDLIGATPRPCCIHEPSPVLFTDLARAVDDAVRWLERTIISDGEHLWPPSCLGLTFDPCNVQTGASGVGLFLCHAIKAGENPTARTLVKTAATWVSDTIAAEPQRPSGLYFGRAGAVWFLTEAAGCLEDATILDRASELALALPTASFNSDITHGTAGIGLAQLHHWVATGDDRFLERAEAAVHAVQMATRHRDEGVVWPVPDNVASNFANLTSYGFAHGNAGIAYFLLCAAEALGEPRYRELAVEGLETLVRVAHVDGGRADWQAGVDRTFIWPHWCNGASGVGTALIRGWSVTGDYRYRELAELAAAAVMKEAWRAAPIQCHGLSGNAEFLLDLHAFTGEQKFREMALQLAGDIYAQRIYEEDLLVFPDEEGTSVSASFNTGLAGVGSFLLRFLHGGPRPLLIDQLIVPAVQEVVAR